MGRPTFIFLTVMVLQPMRRSRWCVKKENITADSHSNVSACDKNLTLTLAESGFSIKINGSLVLTFPTVGRTDGRTETRGRVSQIPPNEAVGFTVDPLGVLYRESRGLFEGTVTLPFASSKMVLLRTLTAVNTPHFLAPNGAD